MIVHTQRTGNNVRKSIQCYGRLGSIAFAKLHRRARPASLELRMAPLSRPRSKAHRNQGTEVNLTKERPRRISGIFSEMSLKNSFLMVVIGYDTKVMRKVVALRKRDKDDIAEEEAVLEMYKEALGM